LPKNVDKIELLIVEVAIQGADIHLMFIDQNNLKESVSMQNLLSIQKEFRINYAIYS